MQKFALYTGCIIIVSHSFTPKEKTSNRGFVLIIYFYLAFRLVSMSIKLFV